MTGEYAQKSLDRNDAVYVAGHRGLVGSAIWRRLEADGFNRLVGRTSAELDLRDRGAVFEFFAAERPKNVVLAAAKVGGILANSTLPVDFISDNLRIQVNVMDAAAEFDVDRLLFLGSSCIYPKFAPQPIREEYLLTGHLEPTNDAYAIAKIAGILQVQAVRKQFGRPWISAMPTNLYGPGDNFSAKGSHVLPALIRRFDDARRDGAASVVNWGTGTPRREFLHVDDMADACFICSTTMTEQNTSMLVQARTRASRRSLRSWRTRSGSTARSSGIIRNLTGRRGSCLTSGSFEIWGGSPRLIFVRGSHRPWSGIDRTSIRSGHEVLQHYST